MTVNIFFINNSYAPVRDINFHQDSHNSFESNTSNSGNSHSSLTQSGTNPGARHGPYDDSDLDSDEGRTRGYLFPNTGFHGDDDTSYDIPRMQSPRSPTTSNAHLPHYESVDLSTNTSNRSDPFADAGVRWPESSSDYVLSRQLNPAPTYVSSEAYRAQAQRDPRAEVEQELEVEHDEGDCEQFEHSPIYAVGRTGQRRTRRTQTMPTPFSFPEPLLTGTLAHAHPTGMSHHDASSSIPRSMTSSLAAAPLQFPGGYHYVPTPHHEMHEPHSSRLNAFDHDAEPAFHLIAPASSHPSEPLCLDAGSPSHADFNYPHRTLIRSATFDGVMSLPVQHPSFPVPASHYSSQT